MNRIVEALMVAVYERATGRPYWSGRCATVDFGPPPGAVYADRLAGYGDADLIAHGTEILAHLQDVDRAQPPQRVNV